MQRFFCLLIAVVVASAGKCTAKDGEVYAKIGTTFPSLFRSFAGLTVSKSSYEDRIVRETKLSPACASCYGDAMMCGWNSCRWSCSVAGSYCDTCLLDNHCTQTCEQCTGF
jgi:hypothetical protein